WHLGRSATPDAQTHVGGRFPNAAAGRSTNDRAERRGSGRDDTDTSAAVTTPRDSDGTGRVRPVTDWFDR
ncbi:hypothetical protein PM022_20190, partial [Halorubrum ezzemoulense]|uniref:hypothetical protein n=1 Tax=Halorubrum ezzemoulense TaxID=337243 RepID=UPI0023310A1A